MRENETDVFREDEINKDENTPSGVIPNHLPSATTLSQTPHARPAHSPVPLSATDRGNFRKRKF